MRTRLARESAFRLGGVLFLAVGLVGAGLAAAARPASVADTPPEVTPIRASFSEAVRATFYTITIKKYPTPAGKPADWSWVFDAPKDDPTCNQFSIVYEDSDESRARYDHGDDKGCHHASPSHNADVGVVLGIGTWQCIATYHGTLDGDGPPPKCENKAPTTTTKPTTTAPPPAKHSLSPEAKADLRKQGKKHALKGIGYGAIALIATVGAGFTAPTGIGGVVLIGVAVNFGTMAVDNVVDAGSAAIELQNDPPDANVKSVAVPGLVPPQHARGCTKATGAAAAPCRSVLRTLDVALTASRQVPAIHKAVITAQNRYGTAARAGNSAAVRLQAAAIAVDLGLLAGALDASSRAESAAADALRAAGVTRLVIHPTPQNKLKSDVELIALMKTRYETRGLERQAARLTASGLAQLVPAVGVRGELAAKLKADATAMRGACSAAALRKAAGVFAADVARAPAAIAAFLREAGTRAGNSRPACNRG